MSIRTMQIELEQWGQWARAEEGGLPPYQSPAYSLLRHAHFSQVAGGAKIAERQQAAFEGAELEAHASAILDRMPSESEGRLAPGAPRPRGAGGAEPGERP